MLVVTLQTIVRHKSLLWRTKSSLTKYLRLALKDCLKYVCMYVRMYVCMYVCMYECMQCSTYIYDHLFVVVLFQVKDKLVHVVKIIQYSSEEPVATEYREQGVINWEEFLNVGSVRFTIR